eukprot:GHVO01067605.1.p2 GENE.GHVO01067605.1~~GHVO01067605.1.p2  ORF type:complete len:273 (+),score=41.36 GHVO01067605.1:1007-1825(+)
MAAPKPYDSMHHLSCYLGGMLMLGANAIDECEPLWILMAAELTRTCADFALNSKSGLAVEAVRFSSIANAREKSSPASPFLNDPIIRSHLMGREAYEANVKDWDTLKNTREDSVFELLMNRTRFSFSDVPNNMMFERNSDGYELRPEIVESIYHMHLYTGDPIYRHWGYLIFDAIRTNLKVKHGYSSAKHAHVYHSNKPVLRDYMDTFFVAETLKYLYLLFSPPDVVLRHDEWVFNTEAHPMPIIKGGVPIEFRMDVNLTAEPWLNAVPYFS